MQDVQKPESKTQDEAFSHLVHVRLTVPTTTVDKQSKSADHRMEIDLKTHSISTETTETAPCLHSPREQSLKPCNIRGPTESRNLPQSYGIMDMGMHESLFV